MTEAMHNALLATVNAPYRSYMDADALAAALRNGEIEKGQIGAFFTETGVGAQKAFGAAHDIDEDVLKQAAAAFAQWSGQPVALSA